MAWETRGGTRRYYTRSVRRDGRVARVYVGGGPIGETAAASDRERRRIRADEDAARIAHLDRLAALDAQVSAFSDAAEVVLRASFLIAGYHRHDRGSWRRRRE